MSKADKVQAVNRAARRAGKKEARDAAASE
jgi:hypothetical protein